MKMTETQVLCQTIVVLALIISVTILLMKALARRN